MSNLAPFPCYQGVLVKLSLLTENLLRSGWTSAL